MGWMPCCCGGGECGCDQVIDSIDVSFFWDCLPCGGPFDPGSGTVSVNCKFTSPSCSSDFPVDNVCLGPAFVVFTGCTLALITTFVRLTVVVNFQGGWQYSGFVNLSGTDCTDINGTNVTLNKIAGSACAPASITATCTANV